MPAPPPLTLGDLTSIVWRRRIWASCSAILVATAVILGSFRMTPLYESKAALAVDRGRQAVEFNTDPDANHIEYSLLNTQRDLLLSNEVLSHTLEATDLGAEQVYAEKKRSGRGAAQAPERSPPAATAG